jgi:hypothetical protein
MKKIFMLALIASLPSLSVFAASQPADGNVVPANDIIEIGRAHV